MEQRNMLSPEGGRLVRRPGRFRLVVAVIVVVGLLVMATSPIGDLVRLSV